MLKEAENKNKPVYSRIRPFELLLTHGQVKEKLMNRNILAWRDWNYLKKIWIIRVLTSAIICSRRFSINFSISTWVPSLNFSTRSNALLIRIRGA